MDGVILKVSNQLIVDSLSIIYGSISKLFQNIVKARSPLTRSSLGSEGTVVYHEGNSTVMHVGTERIDSFNDGFIDHLRIGMSSLKENITLSHHGGDIYSRSEGIQWDLVLITSGTDFLSHLPGEGSVNLSNGVFLGSISVHDDGTNLITGRNLVVNLLKNFFGRHVGCRVGLFEDLLIFLGKTVVYSLDSLGGDDLDNVSSDGFAGFSEGLFGCHSLTRVAAEERFDDSMDGSEEDSTLTVDIRAVFGTKGGFKHKGRSKSDSPSKSKVGCLSGYILVNSKRCIDSSSIDFLTLLVKTTNRRSHTLGAYCNYIHILGESLSNGIKVSKKESVRKSKGSTGLHGSKYILVQFCLCSI
mmetsp:Transcript_13342/g.25041  ORF Transcript_13342/g.25041 Transcript_13342/m.25041 type:complete len:357 (+) Transcript_13342:161-1231(+)